MKLRNLEITDIEQVVKLWNENTKMYKPFTLETFKSHVLNHPDFKIDGAFVATDNDKIIGLGIAVIRKIDVDNIAAPGYMTTLLVHKEYRRVGVAKKLLTLMEEYVKNHILLW